jgi:hydrogenase maturation protein HypF
MTGAYSIRVRGVVQGVGFRPFVYRLARAHTLGGWVINAEEGVEIHVEGARYALQAFLHELETKSPPAAQITALNVRTGDPAGLSEFTIRESRARNRPSVRISADLPVCESCLAELFDPCDRRYFYPYINCTNCGPRYTVILGLPYDRPRTTMQRWSLDEYCASEYHDPANRRFHAQPVACPACGPHYELRAGGKAVRGDEASVRRAAELLADGKIAAIKGLGGYHLACDATNPSVVLELRVRKYRKEKPFALLAKNLEVARGLVQLSPEAERLLTSAARPIVLAPARAEIPGVAPGSDELGVMLPYAPLHYMLFAAGAPDILVMTSANRSSEPICYEDEDALARLAGLADVFLVGERPVARRVDDSVARVGALGPMILRRARGYAPGVVANLPARRPVLALGADLKNSITLVVDGQAFVSQHIGDLDHYESFRAFKETVLDLVSMYGICWENLTVAYDAHPQYASSRYALGLPVRGRHAVQHHRAHVASVLAEWGQFQKRVLGVCFDGTGYGDDGSIWGGEIFVGSVAEGFERVAHLRPAALAGGDAAAHYPVQAAAGFLLQVSDACTLPDLTVPPFEFPARYRSATELVRKEVRTFTTTSVGRLFDAAAALLGFTRRITYEGQAATWLEHLARSAPPADPYPFPFEGGELDFRPLLHAVATDRLRGRDRCEVARAFQLGIAHGLGGAVKSLCQVQGTAALVLSGGVFQNALLLSDLMGLLDGTGIEVMTNRLVPPNDGGISLGQAALATFQDARPNDDRAAFALGCSAQNNGCSA